MKQFLRLFAVVGVVLLTALISAGSCDNKDPEANKNTNNNSGGNSGGDGTGNGNGNGNTGGGTAATVKITFPDATFAKRSGVADIVLKASAFPTTVAGAATVGMDTVNAATAATTRKAAFSLEFDGATGGLTIVDNISKVGQAGVTMSLPTAAALGATDTDGVKVVKRTTADGTTGVGMNIVGIFASKITATTATAVATAAPFAFSASANTQPILWCVSTIPGITAAATATSTLAGGQKADCYVASIGANALGGATDSAAWLGTAAPFKKSVGIAVVSIKTDAKTITDIGLGMASDTDATKVAAFNDGITTAELGPMLQAAGASNLAVGTFIVKILSDGDFTTAPAVVNPPTP